MEFQRVLTPARTVPDNHLIKISVTYDNGELRFRGCSSFRIREGECAALRSINISPLKSVGSEKVFRLVEYWDRWNMNHMQAGTPKQMDFLAEHGRVRSDER